MMIGRDSRRNLTRFSSLRNLGRKSSASVQTTSTTYACFGDDVSESSGCGESPLLKESSMTSSSINSPEKAERGSRKKLLTQDVSEKFLDQVADDFPERNLANVKPKKEQREPSSKRSSGKRGSDKSDEAKKELQRKSSSKRGSLDKSGKQPTTSDSTRLQSNDETRRRSPLRRSKSSSFTIDKPQRRSSVGGKPDSKSQSKKHQRRSSLGAKDETLKLSRSSRKRGDETTTNTKGPSEGNSSNISPRSSEHKKKASRDEGIAINNSPGSSLLRKTASSDEGKQLDDKLKPVTPLKRMDSRLGLLGMKSKSLRGSKAFSMLDSEDFSVDESLTKELKKAESTSASLHGVKNDIEQSKSSDTNHGNPNDISPETSQHKKKSIYDEGNVSVSPDKSQHKKKTIDDEGNASNVSPSSSQHNKKTNFDEGKQLDGQVKTIPSLKRMDSRRGLLGLKSKSLRGSKAFSLLDTEDESVDGSLTKEITKTESYSPTSDGQVSESSESSDCDHNKTLDDPSGSDVRDIEDRGIQFSSSMTSLQYASNPRNGVIQEDAPYSPKSPDRRSDNNNRTQDAGATRGVQRSRSSSQVGLAASFRPTLVPSNSRRNLNGPDSACGVAAAAGSAVIQRGLSRSASSRRIVRRTAT